MPQCNMKKAIEAYDSLTTYMMTHYNAVPAQMFGKKCIKVNNKAAVALFQEFIVFKLPKETLDEALCLEGSSLWDPSGKGRAMKEWVQISTEHVLKFQEFSTVSAHYVS